MPKSDKCGLAHRAEEDPRLMLGLGDCAKSHDFHVRSRALHGKTCSNERSVLHQGAGFAGIGPGCSGQDAGWMGDTKSAGFTVKMLASHVVSTFSAVLPKSTP